MNLSKITSANAPAAIGPYSQAIKAGNTLYTSGMLPLDEQGNLVEGIEAQTNQALKNLQAVLTEAGFTFENVVKSSVFLTNLENFQSVNEIYSRYFSNHHPARTTVEVSKLPKNALIEIELVAVK